MGGSCWYKYINSINIKMWHTHKHTQIYNLYSSEWRIIIIVANLCLCVFALTVSTAADLSVWPASNGVKLYRILIIVIKIKFMPFNTNYTAFTYIWLEFFALYLARSTATPPPSADQWSIGFTLIMELNILHADFTYITSNLRKNITAIVNQLCTHTCTNSSINPIHQASALELVSESFRDYL